MEMISVRLREAYLGVDRTLDTGVASDLAQSAVGLIGSFDAHDLKDIWVAEERRFRLVWKDASGGKRGEWEAHRCELYDEPVVLASWCLQPEASVRLAFEDLKQYWCAKAVLRALGLEAAEQF